MELLSIISWEKTTVFLRENSKNGKIEEWEK